MQIITKQVSVLIGEDEQKKLFSLVTNAGMNPVCDIINCADCAPEVCNKNICPFYSLDDELREVMDKIFEAAKEYGPKEK